MYNKQLSTDTRKKLRSSLVMSVQQRVGEMMVRKQRVPNHLVMAGNVMRLPKEAQEDYKKTGEIALEMFPVLDQIKNTMADAWKYVPVPVVCPLPEDIISRSQLMTFALKDTEAMMYVYVTEAIGVKRSVLETENGKESIFASTHKDVSDAHPDNVTNYVVLSIMANKLEPITYAAEVGHNIINREGDYGRKLREFKPYKMVLPDLPTTEHIQPKLKNQ